MSRFLYRNLELLEPYEGKLSCTVLRGESSRKGADLPDQNKEYPAFHWNNYRFYFQRVIHSRIEKNYFDEGFIWERDVLEENN